MEGSLPWQWNHVRSRRDILLTKIQQKFIIKEDTEMVYYTEKPILCLTKIYTSRKA